MPKIDVPDYLAEAMQNIANTLGGKGKDYQLDSDPWSGFRRAAAHKGLELWELADILEEHKLSRVATLDTNGRGAQNEAVADSYLDKAGYAILAYAMLLDAQEDTPVNSTDTEGSDSGEHKVNPENYARISCGNRALHTLHTHTETTDGSRALCDGDGYPGLQLLAKFCGDVPEHRSHTWTDHDRYAGVTFRCEGAAG